MALDDERHARTVYDTVADTYADHFRTTEPELAIELAALDHFCGLLAEPRRVLDAGCGAGRLLPWLAARGCRPQGVDLSAGMVRRARFDHPAFPAAVATLRALPFEDGCFDGVLSWYSTIHAPDEDLPMLVGEMVRVLRPGGHLCLGFQTGAGRREVGQGYRSRGHDVHLVRHLRTAGDMALLLEQWGLEVVCRVERTASGTERDGQAVLVARRPEIA